MPRFYLIHEFKLNEVITLPSNVVSHINVLRLNQGEMITLFNGDGFSYTAKIIEIARRKVMVEVLERQTLTTHLVKSNLHLAMSIINQDKMDLAIQKATELGVKHITLIDTQYSKKIKADKVASKMEHWRNIIISSCEQCGLNTLPQLHPITSFSDFVLAQSHSKANKLLFSLNGTKLELSRPESQDYIILIGPEGGFTPEEEQFATDHKFLPIKLNTYTLRAETAAIAALAVISHLAN